MVPTNPYGHVNEDDLYTLANEARRKRRRNILMSIIIITGFIAGIVILLSVTTGRLRTPKFRVRSATFGTFNFTNSTSNPSFDIVMNAEFGIKNTNFRRFRYRRTTVDFYYRERKVGDGIVWNDKVKGRDTRKFVVPVILSSANATSSSLELGSDFNGGVLPLTSKSRLTGKFKILIFLRKYKHVNMECSMDLVIANRVLTNISCR
ncbi:late embryogenesis abundant protein At1g64065-like [Rutidosis leptorrhynchoides]|uniref:late embryogenesis abundant protein At1g64065-like n=1 Tax=Rutidosis leptorrhynchoides TaxID=125765 RepID=UPI003A9926BB